MADNHYDEFLQWLKDKEEREAEETNHKSIDSTYDQKSEMNLSDQDKGFTNNVEDESIEDNKYFTQENPKENRDGFRRQFTSQQYDNVNKIYVDKEYVDQQIKKIKPKHGFLKGLSLIVVGALLATFIGPAINNMFFDNNLVSQETIEENPNSNNTLNISLDEETNVENAVAKKAIPSVVGIHTAYVNQNDFFMGRGQQFEGIGSGVIVSEDGYILTNAHVVGENPSQLNVLLSDNTTAEATIVYKDETLDLAVIKIEKTGLPAIEFADSDQVQIGDKAIAIGNPLGFNLQSTLTSGYVSGLSRTITMEGGTSMNGLIQTDASINSGNSGGALLNANGQLIGINTAKAGSTDGIGFAIPANTAKNIVDQIIENGTFSPVVLGVRGVELALYRQYTMNNQLPVDEGVYISEVVPGSSAADAGVQNGDIITKLNGKQIGSMNELKQELIKYRIGDTGTITVYRQNQEMQLDLLFEGESPNI